MAAAAPKRDVFRAVADINRRVLLQLLAEREMSLTEIARHFQTSRTAVAKHLRVLRNAGLVSVRRAGRETRYRLRPEPLLELRQWLTFFERFWQDKMVSLKHIVGHPEANGTNGTVATSGGDASACPGGDHPGS